MRANHKDEYGLGYTQIGQWCDSGRRSLWCRITPRRESIIDADKDPWFVADPPNILFIELCAGREGDDAYVKIEPSHPLFEAMLDLGRLRSLKNNKPESVNVADALRAFIRND